MATLKKDHTLVFKTDYRLVQVKKHSEILLTFIKLPFVLSIFKGLVNLQKHF